MTLVQLGQLILALMILVTLHELGHFGFAKWFKTRVEKFIIFFDPYWTPIQKKIGETVYGFGWLPLGGYVKISGMIDESMDTKHMHTAPEPWEFRSKTAWQRFFIMIGGILVNVLLSFVIFAGVLMAYGKTYMPNNGVTHGLRFHTDLQQIGFQDGDMITAIDQKPVTRVDPGEFMESMILGGAKQVTVQRGSDAVVIPIPPGFGKQLASNGVKKANIYEPRTMFIVDSLLAGKPAALAGLQKGDRTLSINGREAVYFHQFSALAKELKGQDVQIVLVRGADTLTLPVKISDEGTVGVFPDIKGQIKTEQEKYSFARAVPGGIHWSVDFLVQQIRAFGKMFSGEINAKDNLGSVISIGKMFSTTWDWERFWILTASLSMLLAFMNLLPIPGLDGGYIFFLIWEMITGRRVSDQFMIKAVNIGFFLLIGLMIYALGLDLNRLFSR